MIGMNFHGLGGFLYMAGTALLLSIICLILFIAWMATLFIARMKNREHQSKGRCAAQEHLSMGLTWLVLTVVFACLSGWGHFPWLDDWGWIWPAFIFVIWTRMWHQPTDAEMELKKKNRQEVQKR